MIIYIDADACPGVIREILYRASQRTAIPLVFISNRWQDIPRSALFSQEVVPQGPDVADDRIVALVSPGDLVVTADIPLADRVVEKGAFALNPRGELYTADTIKSRLAVRDLREELRSGGMELGGPAPLSVKHKQAFAAALDRFLARALR